MTPMSKMDKHKNHHPLKLSCIISQLDPTIKNFQRIELEILKGQNFDLKNPLFLLRSTPTSQRNQLPNSENPSLLQSSSSHYQHIFDI